MPQTSIRPDDFAVNRMQGVIWLEGYEPSRRAVMALATGPWAARFDGEPTMFPDAAAIELPRALIASADRAWRVQVSRQRLDVFWDRQALVKDVSPKEFSDAVLETIRAYVGISDEIIVRRVAYVVQRLATRADPGKLLVDYFIRPDLRTGAGPLNRPSDFELHAHKVYSPAGMPQINSWIRWKTAALQQDQTPAMLVEQDLNTLVDNNVSFRPSDLEQFFHRAPAEAESVLQIYLRFPTGS